VRTDAIVYGIALFVWTRVEDNAVWTAAAFGVGLMWVIFKPHPLPPSPDGEGERSAMTPPLNMERGRGGGVVLALLRGALIGGGGAVAAAALMLLKNGLHAHAFPDYPFGVIAALIARAPVWAAAGALVGVGVSLLRSTLPKRAN